MTWALMGWPLVAAAIVAFGLAIWTRLLWAGLVGALIAAPLCLYLKDFPFLHWVSPEASPHFSVRMQVW